MDLGEISLASLLGNDYTTASWQPNMSTRGSHIRGSAAVDQSLGTKPMILWQYKSKEAGEELLQESFSLASLLTLSGCHGFFTASQILTPYEGCYPTPFRVELQATKLLSRSMKLAVCNTVSYYVWCIHQQKPCITLNKGHGDRALLICFVFTVYVK